jgi:hypothetical protein
VKIPPIVGSVVIPLAISVHRRVCAHHRALSLFIALGAVGRVGAEFFWTPRRSSGPRFRLPAHGRASLAIGAT